MAKVFPISGSGSGSSGLTAAEVVEIAQGLDIIAADAANAAAGNGGATTGFVAAPPEASINPNTRLVSLADNNNIFINGVFVGGFNLGDIYTYQATHGDVIASDKGVTGAYAGFGGNERPVELASAAGAGTQFFWFAFRSPPHLHFITTLALEAVVNIYGPDPNVNADGTSPDTPLFTATIPPFTTVSTTTPTDGEYYLLADQPVALTTSNSNGAQDQRVVQPLANELLGGVAGAGAGDESRIASQLAWVRWFHD